MSKNLVLVISIGDMYEDIFKLTSPFIEKYAKKIDADFLVIKEKKISKTSPHWEKFQIYDLFNDYDRIIYFDSDILIREDCPNLFEIVPVNKIGMFNEAPFTDGRFGAIEKACIDHGIKLQNWDGKYYNTGVIIASKRHKYLFKKPELEEFNFYEQSWFNINLASDKNVRIEDIKYHFNRMCCMDPILGEERHTSYIIHYAGIPNLLHLPQIIKEDIKKWEKSFPDYNYKKHILIDVQGGLGDQVDAEPAIRYLIENVYKDQDVRVCTHFPRLFSHLKIPVFLHGETQLIPDVPYHKMLSLPGPDTMMWRYVSNLLCHTGDFIAMALLRRTLPNKDKTIKLELHEEDFNNLNEITKGKKFDVAIHAGKHWASKTFPESWWQELIDKLSENKNLNICLIGRNDDESRGIVDVNCPENIVDLRDILDLGSFLVLLSETKVLVSNDSSPVHLAGAFDNNIIMIPTCKHPDHIFPYRNGSINYKTKALYKKLTLDAIPQAPTEIYGTTADYVVGDILDYIPEVDDVVAAIYDDLSIDSSV